MKVAVLKETFPGEARVALIPANVAQLAKVGLEVVVEQDAGMAAGFADADYEDKGAKIAPERDALFDTDVVLQVRALGANPAAGQADVTKFRQGQIVVGMCDPLGEPAAIQTLASQGVSLCALEMIPRITRAQSMDILSSMATIAGYRAVLMAALELPKMFPMLMTAAGTLTAARVFVIGGGVAGLQAIATARRLGGVVQAYDVRPAVREQVESLGAKFVELELEADSAEDKGGYAKAMGEEFYQQQREFMGQIAAESDVVISTAAIPGRQSPLLLTETGVAGMAPGSVVVDLAAERGGNCELSAPDQRVVKHGVVILGPTNLPAEVAFHASQMFSNNVTKFLLNMAQDGNIVLNTDDEIVHDTLVAHGGEVTSPRIRDLLDLPALPTESAESAEDSAASGDAATTESTEE